MGFLSDRDSSEQNFTGMNPSLVQFLLVTQQETALRNAHLGLDALENQMMGSVDIVLGLFQHQHEMTDRWCGALSVDQEKILELLNSVGDTNEPAPEPNAFSAEAAELDPGAKRMLQNKRVVSSVVRDALKRIKHHGKQTGTQPKIGDLAVALLEGEGEVRDTVLQVVSPDELERSLSVLKETPEKPVDFMAATMSNMRGLLDKMWPKLQEEALSNRPELARAQAVKDELYEQDPSRYEERLPLSDAYSRELPEGKEFLALTGLCLHAAGNEARIRKAPFVTLDHMIAALLQPGTHTFDFLESRGIDPVSWYKQLDKRLARQESGPRWPENSRDLTMNLPSDQKMETTRPISEIDFDNLPREEILKFYQSKPTGEEFSDLHFLKAVLNEPQTLSHGLLTSAGLTASDF